MKLLELSQYMISAPLFEKVGHHTFIHAILEGLIPGHIYVDDQNSAKLAVAQFRHRVCLSGDPNQGLNEALMTFFLEDVIQNCREAGVPLFRLVVNHPDWLNIISRGLGKQNPIISTYQCYQYKIDQDLPTFEKPAGFDLKIVNRDLLDDEFFGKEDLLEEMCSERSSVESFLEQSFGIAAFHQNKLAGWCLSEYNVKNQCEVGIATIQLFQRQGLARTMTLAFLNLAREKGYTTILWHCEKENTASWKTALSAGFKLLEEEQVLILFHDPTINMAVHGNIWFEKQDYVNALKWYEKALNAQNPQTWMAWNAACAAASAEEIDLVFTYLDRAVDMGFSDRNYLENHKHMQLLKNDSRWQSLISRIEEP